MPGVLDAGPIALSAPAGGWRGPVLATLLHLSVAALWLCWPAPVPRMDSAPVVELVLAPPPAPPQPEPPAAAAPPQPQPQPQAMAAAPPTPAPARPAPRPAPGRPAPTPVSTPAVQPSPPAARSEAAVAAAPVAPPAVTPPAPLPAPATPHPVATADPDLKPTPSEAPRPAYPRAARQRGLQGVVMVRVEVAADGLPTEVAVTESSGHAMLDDAAVNAVRHWRFTPARAGGRAVAAVVEVPVRFTLEG